MNIDRKCIDAIRVLSADAIQKANSGHPGLPLGAAPMAYELWGYHMKHNPANAGWVNRDRFILSAGHGSMLLYSLLHLFGYGLDMEELVRFRQMDSLTPGHPEYGITTGVEATTGPLGAGMGMAVGMAVAEEHLAAVFNRPGYPVVDHYTYVLGGDGCMMEGISYEAFSMAGSLKLGKLIVLYDCNHISIEGSTDLAFTEDVPKRMEALGFQVLCVEDGNDLEEIGRAIEAAKADVTRPSFLLVKTKIGYGCPAKEGKASAHGEPLGVENVAALRENLGWESKEPFTVPQDVYDRCADLAKKGAAAEEAWQKMFAAYQEAWPDLAAKWNIYFDRAPAELIGDMEDFAAVDEEPKATRAWSGTAINRLKDMLPNLIGGSADLAPSNKTLMSGEGDFSKDNYGGRNLHFGVREMAMAACVNGIALHGGLRAYAGTFFVFSDYMKPMIRLSALMKLPVTYILTHDSIGVGEDGPTHQPVEQLAMLRSMPNLHVFRPADGRETMVAWYLAATSQTTPTALVLTRQNLPVVSGTGCGAAKGAYIIQDGEKPTPDLILIATGSEVSVAAEAAAILRKDNLSVRVVSMPCMELFEEQSEEYKEAVLPKAVRKRVAVEAQINFGWGNYVGLDGAMVAMNDFGASAPAGELFERYGFTAGHVARVARELLER